MVWSTEDQSSCRWSGIRAKGRIPSAGAADLCFIVRTLLDPLVAQFLEAGIAIVEGPVDGTGALGPIRTVYIRDPDGNLIELSNYLD